MYTSGLAQSDRRRIRRLTRKLARLQGSHGYPKSRLAALAHEEGLHLAQHGMRPLTPPPHCLELPPGFTCTSLENATVRAASRLAVMASMALDERHSPRRAGRLLRHALATATAFRLAYRRLARLFASRTCLHCGTFGSRVLMQVCDTCALALDEMELAVTLGIDPVSLAPQLEEPRATPPARCDFEDN